MAKARNRGKNARNIKRSAWFNEAEDLQLQASAGDIPLATWMHDVLLSKTPQKKTVRPSRKPPSRTPGYAPIVQPLRTAVSWSGNNLNQLARVANTLMKEGRAIDGIALSIEVARYRQELHDGIRQVFIDFVREKNGARTNLQTR